MTHYNSSEHPLALDMDSLACHWYVKLENGPSTGQTRLTQMQNSYICDEYVTEDDPRLDAIRESIKSSKQSPFQMKASSESAKKKKKHAVTGKKFEHLTGLSNLGILILYSV